MPEKTILFFHDEKNETEKRKFGGLLRYAETCGMRAIAIDSAPTAKAERDMIRFWNPAAIVVHRGHLLHKKPSIPIVFLGLPDNPRSRTYGYVYVDNAAVAEVAARELLALNLDHYAFVSSPKKSWWNDARIEAFKPIIRSHGKSFAALIADRRNAPSHGWDERIATFLYNLPKPCGIFAATDETGIRIIHIARQLRIAVPEEIAVCGVGGIEDTCLLSTPTLTSAMPDFERCGILAGEMAVRMIKSPGCKPAPQAYGVISIIRRGSTRLTASRDTLVEKALDFINSHASTGIGAKDVVALFPCSRRMAEIRFERITHHSILDEIIKTRLQLAKSLLSKGSMPLSAVSDLSGWKSYNVFRNRFKELTGHSPSNWRKQNASRP